MPDSQLNTDLKSVGDRNKQTNKEILVDVAPDANEHDSL